MATKIQIKIKRNRKIKIREELLKLTLFADDMILYIGDLKDY